MTPEPRLYRKSRKQVEDELELARAGRRRVAQRNKVLYNDRIKRLERELEAFG